MVGSIFDEFGDDRSSLVFHDYYRIGQPKKLVDDCLKKEKELRILPLQEDEDREEGEDYLKSVSEVEEEANSSDDNGGEDSAQADSDAESDTEFTSINISASQMYDDGEITTAAGLRVDITTANSRILSPAVYTPSRDVIDNFVPGTLDEDQIERDGGRSPLSPHDIDPTYPSDEDEDGEQQPQRPPLLSSPVRFIPNRTAALTRRPANTTSQVPANGLNRTLSLPWSRRRYNSHLKPPFIKRTWTDQPKRSAIAITKSIEHHKRHHRREKRGDAGHGEEGKGLGAAAMAAMARQLTNKHTLVGDWALSV
jgi:hypothetical protein